MSIASPSELRSRQFDLLDVREPWRSAIGRIEQPAYALVSGPPGAGKSTFMLALAGLELARHGTVLFNSAEEMLGVTLAQKLDRLGIDSDDLVLGEYQDIDEMKYAADFEGVDFLVVDSISERDPGAGQVEALRSYCKDKSIGLWLIAHELKVGGEYKGPSNLGHGTDVVARVTEDGEFVASKNRYAQTGESTSVPFSADDLGAAASSGDGVDTRENPELSVRKHTDHGDNEPGRLDQAWNGETIDVPFEVERWHTDPEAFIERFSLGGVEFGRWMEADDRARFLAWAAQGLTDFCDLFSLAYKRAGFGERIKLALGARGKGGRVAAHYEPTPRHTINLTKPEGKGSLAHEYAHALDNMAALRFGLSTFASGGESHRTAPDLSELDGDDPVSILERFFAALYFEEIDESGGGEHVMREWAKQLHHEDTREYFKRRTEVLARSLETHVRNGLQEKRSSDDWNTWLAKPTSRYLASGVYPPEYILGDEAGRHLTAFVQAIFGEEIEMRDNPSPAIPRENPGATCVVEGEWQRNEEQEGVEISFSTVPPPEARDRLKDHGFIFAFQDQFWFADATDENVALARELIGDGDAQPVQAMPGGDSNVMVLEVEDIVVDPERFQPRENAYSEETARTVAEDFDEQKMEPIRVWEDPEAGGDWHVLAGFSRLEGYKRRGEDTIPARPFEGTEKEAVRFAWEENEKGDALTATERAAYLRMLRETEELSLNELTEKAKDLYGRDARTILALSFLKPQGKAMQTLRQLKGNAAGDYNTAETMAVWVGKVRRYNRDLTDSHEREIYNFLLDNFREAGKGFTSAAGFREFVEEVKGRRSFMGEFDASEPLNFAEIVPKSPQQERIDELVREARAEFREAQKELEEERKKYIERGAEGADLQRALKPYQKAADAAQAHVIEVEQEARDGRARLGQSEQGLFEEIRDNPAGGELAGFLTQLGTCVELETTEALYEAAGDDYPMFTGPDGKMLLVCPAERVEPAAEASEGGEEASEMYETWHGFEPDADVEVALSGQAWREAGTAERIVYASDKIVRPGDREGDDSLYEHDFDAGEREVYEWGECLVITGLMIDRRGILN